MDGERFARRMFRGAAIYGAIVLLPLYLVPVPVEFRATHFGFVGCALAFQWVFWLIGGDPLKYRALMLPAVAEKLVFAVPALALFAMGHLEPIVAGFAAIDIVLGTGFLIARARLGNQPA
jgi:hypothetical protein